MTPSPGDVERPARQQRHLDLPGDAQLFLEPLLLSGRLQQVLDAAGHLVERIRQLAELVVRDWMLMRCVKSPCRTRSVPMNSSWTELVIDRASARPMISATNSMIRNRTGDHDQHSEDRVARAACR